MAFSGSLENASDRRDKASNHKSSTATPFVTNPDGNKTANKASTLHGRHDILVEICRRLLVKTLDVVLPVRRATQSVLLSTDKHRLHTPGTPAAARRLQ